MTPKVKVPKNVPAVTIIIDLIPIRKEMVKTCFDACWISVELSSDGIFNFISRCVHWILFSLGVDGGATFSSIVHIKSN